MKIIELSAKIPEELDGLRQDQALAKLFPDYSRERLKAWVNEGFVSIDGQHLRPKDKVSHGATIEINAQLPESTTEAQNIELEIVHEDEDILVINKPIGLVVHPGAGNPDQTLLNALLHHDQNLKTLPRAGIIHRLDKDTSGLLVIAKTLPAHTKLTAMMQAREIVREYRAIVIGEIISGGTIEAPIGRHPKNRIKMAVIDSGKPAVTHYRVLKKLNNFTYLHVQLESGRTHQIRVHMAHIKHPVLGDPVYGGNQRIPTKHLSDEAKNLIHNLHHQALHAYSLTLHHPISNEPLTFTAPLPKYFEELLDEI